MRSSFTPFFVVITIVLVVVRVWQTFFVKGRKEGVKKEGITLPAAVITYNGLIFFTIVEYFLMKRAMDYFLTLSGIVIGITGFTLTLSAIRTLGKEWSFSIEIKREPKIVQEGLYRFIRHPYYVGAALEVLGYTLFANSFYTFTATFFTLIPLLFIRGTLEEKIMEENLKEEYIRYTREVGAIVPFGFRRQR